MTYAAVLAGCGAMSKGWLEAILHAPLLKGKIDICGLVDLDPALAKAQADAFGLEAATGADLAAMIAQTGADMVFDIVPPAGRKSVVLCALGAGCHVLSEKPMAISMADARDMQAAAKTADRVHAIVQNRRYIDGVRRVRALVESGAMGDLTALHCDFFLAPHFGGFRETMDHVLLLDMAIHTFDAARFMSGCAPRAVYAHETNPKGSWYAHGAAANAIFEFSNNVTFTYRGSWAADGAPTSWEGAWRLVGTKGSLIWDGGEHFDARIVASDGKFLNDLKPVAMPPAPNRDQTHGHASVIADFVMAIERGETPETANSDNVKSLAMVFAAIESATSQKRVEVKF